MFYKRRRINNETRKKNKSFLMILGVFILIVAVTGVSIAFFNYTRTGQAKTLRVGDIYFNSSYEGVTLNNVFPVKKENILTDTDNVMTIEITIQGHTAYTAGINYTVTAQNVNLQVNNKSVPISVNVTSEDIPNVKLTSYEDGAILQNDSVFAKGKIVPTDGNVNGTITLRVYLDDSKILISDTYNNGNTPTDNLGTPAELGQGKVVLTTNEWNNVFGGTSPLSFKVKVSAEEYHKPVNACTFDLSTVEVSTYDINKTECMNAYSGMLEDYAEPICSGESVDVDGMSLDFDYLIANGITTIEQAEEHGIISNVVTGPATELKSGMTYVNGQYTYLYIENGWFVTLTDKTSTDAVTTRLCTTVNNYPITNMSGMFNNSRAISIDLSSFDTSNVTNMNTMFMHSQATSLDLSGFDTSNVTDMSWMFYSSQATSLDLSSFDTSNVTDMSLMFDWSQATSIDLSSFDTGNVTNMGGMFSSSRTTSLDLSSFDTSNVTDMSGMFSSSQATSLDLSGFDTSNVTDMSGMFSGSRATSVYVSNLWDTTGVTESSNMFSSSAVVGQNGTKPYTSCAMNGNTWTCTGATGNPLDKTYARVDNAPDTPGYFTFKAAPVGNNG